MNCFFISSENSVHLWTMFETNYVINIKIALYRILNESDIIKIKYSQKSK